MNPFMLKIPTPLSAIYLYTICLYLHIFNILAIKLLISKMDLLEILYGQTDCNFSSAIQLSGGRFYWKTHNCV